MNGQIRRLLCSRLNRRMLLATAGLGAAAASAAEPIVRVDALPDGPVIEAVLLDILDHPVSPRERWGETDGVYYIWEARRLQGRVEDMFDDRFEEWKKLPVEQFNRARQAGADLQKRSNGQEKPPLLRPKDKRIRLQRPQDDAKNVFGAKEWRQVFRIHLPGYSVDGETALVTFAFPWSLGFHGGSCLYLLGRGDCGWAVLVRQIIRFG